MPRITVNISEDVEQWLEAEADRLNWSKAEAGGHCIDVLHSTADHITPQQSAVELPDDSHTLRERLEELEERVASLEPSPATQESAHAGERGGADDVEGDWTSAEVEREHEPPAASEDGAGIEEAVEGVWTDMEHAAERRETAVTALEFLREHSEQRWRRKTLKEELWPETKSYDEESDRIWWEKDVMPGLQAAAEAGIVEFREGHYDYRWSG